MIPYYEPNRNSPQSSREDGITLFLAEHLGIIFMREDRADWEIILKKRQEVV